MERCPNCGAPARSDAKFCTICGRPLAGDDPTAASAGASGSLDDGPEAPGDGELETRPFDDEEGAASGADPEDGDNAPSSATPQPLPESDCLTLDDAAGSSSGEAAPADTILASSWPSPPAPPLAWAGTWISAESDAAVTADREADPEPEPAADTLHSWPSPAPAPDPETEEDRVLSSSDAGTFPDDDAQLPDLPAPEQAEPLDPFPPQPESPAADADSADLGSFGAAWPIAATSAPDTAPAEPQSAPEPDPVEAEDLGRAIALLDELKTLVPRLGAPPPGLDPASMAADLELAIAPESDAPVDFEQLRAAVESVRARPRDIDSVLELSRRGDDLIALFDHLDRARSAIEHAAAKLRSLETSTTRRRTVQ